LFRLGKLLHISSSRNLILRAEVTPPLGVLVLTADTKVVGRVVDVFGPKNAPYVSVKPPSESSLAQTLVGRVLYYDERRETRGKHSDIGSLPIRAKRGGLPS
jgi:rRNA processing protein Gar1